MKPKVKIENGQLVRDVLQVYSGKAGRCYCGCSGKYYRWKEVPQRAMVSKVVNLINANQEAQNWYEKNPEVAQFVSVTIGQRDYVAYFSNYFE